MIIAKENLLLHPVRLRIILAAAGREVTVQQLASELPDIPQATLYRNTNTLATAGILIVVQERRVRNTIEKTYALPGQGLLLSPDDLKEAQPEDFMRLFVQYLGQMLGYFGRYVQKGSIDFARDHVFFQLVPVYMNEAETQRLGQALKDVLLPYLNNGSSPERRRSIIGLMSIPDVGGTPFSADSQASTPTIESTDPRKE